MFFHALFFLGRRSIEPLFIILFTRNKKIHIKAVPDDIQARIIHITLVNQLYTGAYFCDHFLDIFHRHEIQFAAEQEFSRKILFNKRQKELMRAYIIAGELVGIDEICISVQNFLIHRVEPEAKPGMMSSFSTNAKF